MKPGFHQIQSYTDINSTLAVCYKTMVWHVVEVQQYTIWVYQYNYTDVSSIVGQA